MGFWFWLADSFISFFQCVPMVLLFLGLVIVVFSILGVIVFGLAYENIYLVLLAFISAIIGFLLILYAHYLDVERLIYYLNPYV